MIVFTPFEIVAGVCTWTCAKVEAFALVPDDNQIEWDSRNRATDRAWDRRSDRRTGCVFFARVSCVFVYTYVYRSRGWHEEEFQPVSKRITKHKYNNNHASERAHADALCVCVCVLCAWMKILITMVCMRAVAVAALWRASFEKRCDWSFRKRAWPSRSTPIGCYRLGASARWWTSDYYSPLLPAARRERVNVCSMGSHVHSFADFTLCDSTPVTCGHAPGCTRVRRAHHRLIDLTVFTRAAWAWSASARLHVSHCYYTFVLRSLTAWFIWFGIMNEYRRMGFT